MFSEKYRKIGQQGVFVSLLLLLMLHGYAQNSVFVSASAADDSGDGTSWQTAKKTLAAGITEAGTSGTVFVKAGSYGVSAEFSIPAGVTVMGGYEQSSTGTDTSQRRLPGVNAHWTDNTWCTIISGAGNHRIATVQGTLEGCVVRNGSTSSIGGGLLLDGGTARYCVIKECDAINDDDYNAQGGGVYVRNNGVLINCVVTECRGDNGVGVAGEDGSLINNTITRNAPIGCGYVVDYDGNYYDAVQIGSQCWMKQNLRVTHFPDGNSISLATSAQTQPCYYFNNNMAMQVSQYGLLYNWYAAMNGAASSNNNPSGIQGICPNGWHLPSYAEWTLLINFVSSQTRYRCNNDANSVAKSLASKTGWSGSNTTCYVGNSLSTNNATRFSAMPVGYWDGGFSSTYNSVRYWTSTQYNADNAYYRAISYNSASVDNTYWTKTRGLAIRCVRDASIATTGDMTIPFVTTAQVANISTVSATSGGNVTSDGGSVVTARGVCWNTTGDPTINDEHTTNGNGVGNFTSSLTSLEANTTYHVRAYATNAVGTGYGETLIFTTAGQPCPGAPTVTDYDGNTYNTVLIGQQCWMKENLRTTHYPDGSEVTSKSPNNTAATVSVYGLLYNWPAVMNGATSSSANPSYVQGICPTGWHLPSKAEFEQLNSYVSGISSCRCDNNASYIAKALSSTNGWENSTTTCYVGNNQDGNNKIGFTAMPAGHYENGFIDFGRGTWIWSCTAENSTNDYRMRLRYDNRDLNIASNNGSSCYFSVRCVKD